jgi:acetyltransferase EpsM
MVNAASATSARKELILIGGGGHARVVLDAALSRPEAWQVTGFTDPLPRSLLQQAGVTWLGDDDIAAPAIRRQWGIIAVGSKPRSDTRQRIHERFERTGLKWACVIHASATVATSSAVGQGVAVCASATINPGARIDDHAIVNTGAIVEHEVAIGAFVHLGPGAVVGGGASIGRGTYIGLGARVRDHVQVGNDVVIGMGAVVLHDVPDGATFVGVPARPIGDGARSVEPRPEGPDGR